MEELLSRLARRKPVEEPKATFTPQQVFMKYEEYSRVHAFRQGDMVVWKPGLKNRQRPAEGECGIVLEQLAQPLLTSTKKETEVTSPLFREPLDLAVGMLDSDGDLIVFYFDSHRFMPASNATILSPEGLHLRELLDKLLDPLAKELKPGHLVKWFVCRLVSKMGRNQNSSETSGATSHLIPLTHPFSGSLG
eukprot:TRINITY_DN3785_c0_g1_i1.p1 TRINITY_DN3785_c0_g1~~TRINITY_DN3785_c0_g1_i1.p1  ORF type:complete len:199 (-),score=47.14 TRINITY_DN3785_c0_g1_i1:335-910(-)